MATGQCPSADLGSGIPLVVTNHVGNKGGFVGTLKTTKHTTSSTTVALTMGFTMGLTGSLTMGLTSLVGWHFFYFEYWNYNCSIQNHGSLC